MSDMLAWTAKHDSVISDNATLQQALDNPNTFKGATETVTFSDAVRELRTEENKLQSLELGNDELRNFYASLSPPPSASPEQVVAWKPASDFNTTSHPIFSSSTAATTHNHYGGGGGTWDWLNGYVLGSIMSGSSDRTVGNKPSGTSSNDGDGNKHRRTDEETTQLYKRTAQGLAVVVSLFTTYEIYQWWQRRKTRKEKQAIRLVQSKTEEIKSRVADAERERRRLLREIDETQTQTRREALERARVSK